jgi:MoaA/NifB/PqqE/SkfB family radical SAM enzyme
MSRSFGVEAFKRFLTLKTHRVYALPIAILMPHGGCNCRCVMCDIWLGNSNRAVLNEADIQGLLASFRELGTRWVVMSGGEALMNPNLFRFCEILKTEGLRITILSTGLLLERFAENIVEQTDEVIVSLDGSREIHDSIRRVPKGFQKLQEGVQAVKAIDSSYPITGRCVIQRLNFADWPNIVDSARDVGLDQISFLAADVSTEAFNRPQIWDESRSAEVSLEPSQLPELKSVVEQLVLDYSSEISSGFIAESPEKLRRIYDYYFALATGSAFPTVQCNAPWVSAVVEADGTARPCFFHRSMGNIRQASLNDLLNDSREIEFRSNLDTSKNPVCIKCVCTLSLGATTALHSSVVKSV